MTPIEIKSWKYFNDIGSWLEQRFPNPPLPEDQRWSIIRTNDGRWGVNFKEENDATMFGLMWGDKIK